MTEKELEGQIRLQKAVSAEFNELAATIKSEEFEKWDGLNRDLAITQANAMQTLLGVTSVRIGLNIHSVREQAKSEEAEQSKEGPNEQKETAEETSKSE